MTSSDTPRMPVVEDELLEIAAIVLFDANCHVEARRLASGQEYLLAENPYFILCVVTSDSLTQVGELEGLLTAELTSLTHSLDVGAKRWDLYLVLLSQDGRESSKELSSELYRINYDTSHLRRLAVPAVEATLEGVKDALRSFLPMLRASESQPLTDALQELESALIEQGIPSDQAARAVAAFRMSGSLEDV